MLQHSEANGYIVAPPVGTARCSSLAGLILRKVALSAGYIEVFQR